MLQNVKSKANSESQDQVLSCASISIIELMCEYMNNESNEYKCPESLGSEGQHLVTDEKSEKRSYDHQYLMMGEIQKRQLNDKKNENKQDSKESYELHFYLAVHPSSILDFALNLKMRIQ